MNNQSAQQNQSIYYLPATIPEKYTEEDKHVGEIIAKETKKYRDTPKFKAWRDYFLDKSNKQTFGNATQSAILAYNLNPKDQYWSAASIGKDNLQKLQTVGVEYLEKVGITPGMVYQVFWNKALASQNLELLVCLSEWMGIPLPKNLPLKQGFVIQQNNQYNFEGGVNLQGLSDEQLDQLIESKASQVRTLPVASREGATNEAQPTQVQNIAPEATRSNSQPEVSEGVILG